MIQPRTWLEAMDNSGARYVRCIKVLKGFNSASGNVGDFIVLAIRGLRFTRKTKIGEIYFGVIACTTKNMLYKDGSFSNSKSNSVIILNNKKNILGTRLFGFVSKNLRRKKFMRLIIMVAYKTV